MEVKKARMNDPSRTFIWHCRLGHINETRIEKLHKQGYLDPFSYESYGPCECCLIGKMTQTSFAGKGKRVNVLLRLVHSDVCGPLNIAAREGYSYFITFTDDHSSFGYVYLMK